MSDAKGVLIFNENEQERNFLRFFLKTEDYSVYDTGAPLEALRLLQEETIGLMIIGSEFKGMSKEDLKNLIEKLRPGINSIFISPFPEDTKEVSIDIEEFLMLVRDYLKYRGIDNTELSEMKTFSHAIVDRLLQIFSVNDKYFFNNNHLVSELSKKIAQAMELEESLVEGIQMAALLRDLGKLMIHQQMLDEDRRLKPIELIPMRAHPTYTVQILRQVRFPWNLDSIISQHHENYDGSGYPHGIMGREISIGARIIRVADAFYAMTTDRPYRKALSKEDAVFEIRNNAGSQFDPEVVEIFLSVIQREPAETVRKKSVLVFEREPNISSMIKLSFPTDELEILHAEKSIEALGRIRQRNPQLIIADIEALGAEAFMKFYQTVQQAFESQASFLVITPSKDHMVKYHRNIDYILRPLNIDKLRSKIESMLFESPSPESQEGDKGLWGSIEDFCLSDIIQILSIGLKTARVNIYSGDESGVLFLAHGRIVHAAVGNLKGPDAFFEMMRWKEGSFSITHGQMTDELSVTSDTMHLLLEAAKIIDEKRSAVDTR